MSAAQTPPSVGGLPPVLMTKPYCTGTGLVSQDIEGGPGLQPVFRGLRTGADKGTDRQRERPTLPTRAVKVRDSFVVAFSSLARILGEWSTMHSPPAFFFFLKWSLARPH